MIIKFPNFMSLENETVIFATNTREITTILLSEWFHQMDTVKEVQEHYL